MIESHISGQIFTTDRLFAGRLCIPPPEPENSTLLSEKSTVWQAGAFLCLRGIGEWRSR